MASIDTTIVRSAYTTQALATMGADPAWDAALTTYLRATALAEADLGFGAFAKADEQNALEMMAIEETFGKGWRQLAEAVDARNVAFAKVEQAECQRDRDFLEPLWASQRALVKVPAPTFAAALFKANFIETDEAWNDNRLGIDAFEVIAADFARLAREA